MMRPSKTYEASATRMMKVSDESEKLQWHNAVLKKAARGKSTIGGVQRLSRSEGSKINHETGPVISLGECHRLYSTAYEERADVVFTCQYLVESCMKNMEKP